MSILVAWKFSGSEKFILDDSLRGVSITSLFSFGFPDAKSGSEMQNSPTDIEQSWSRGDVNLMFVDIAPTYTTDRGVEPAKYLFSEELDP